MSPAFKKKLSVLLGIYAVLWGGYFGLRAWQYSKMETADATVWAIAWRHFTTGSPRGDYHGSYMTPEVHFPYQDGDTMDMVQAWPDATVVDWYKPGDKVKVIFPKGCPEAAELYSLVEYWLELPYVVTLLFITIAAGVIFTLFVAKPWQQRQEMFEQWEQERDAG